jgi:hypothetical protein
MALGAVAGVAKGSGGGPLGAAAPGRLDVRFVGGEADEISTAGVFSAAFGAFDMRLAPGIPGKGGGLGRPVREGMREALHEPRR